MTTFLSAVLKRDHREPRRLQFEMCHNFVPIQLKRAKAHGEIYYFLSAAIISIGIFFPIRLYLN